MRVILHLSTYLYIKNLVPGYSERAYTRTFQDKMTIDRAHRNQCQSNYLTRDINLRLNQGRLENI